MANKMANKEILKKAWDLVHDKYPENNEEIQLVRYAIKTAMGLTERDTPMKPFYGINYRKGKMDAICPECNHDVVLKENFCSHCGQRIDWS